MMNQGPFRCLALDDELYATQVIETYLSYSDDFVLVKATTDVYEALRMVDAGTIDLVFLDIQMPELTGLQFLRICSNKCKVIFTTAYPDYALEGFDLDAVDYLLKPIELERFNRSLCKFLALQGDPRLNSRHIKDYIFLKGDSKSSYHKVEFKEILYVEGLNNYISVYTAEQRIVTYMSLKDILEMLPPTQFCRIHRSYIISLAHINRIDGGMVYIGSKGFGIGDTYRSEFFKIINGQ